LCRWVFCEAQTKLSDTALTCCSWNNAKRNANRDIMKNATAPRKLVFAILVTSAPPLAWRHFMPWPQSHFSHKFRPIKTVKLYVENEKDSPGLENNLLYWQTTNKQTDKINNKLTGSTLTCDDAKRRYPARNPFCRRFSELWFAYAEAATCTNT